MVLECVDGIARQYPEYYFYFCGSEAQPDKRMAEKVEAMNITDHTLFVEVVSPEDSMVYLAYASILISPRLNGTTIPLKIYSYLHAGKPIVATNIDAHTQVLTADTAMLVDPNQDAFADGVLKLLADPQLAQRLGENAHDLAQEKFNYQNYMLKVNKIYETLESGVALKLPSVPQE
jgi:glycosyltransferase involved in cell wall biosynthesis